MTPVEDVAVRETAVDGLRAFALANDRVEALVCVDRGADVLELRSRASGAQVLWRSPRGERSPARRPFAEHGSAATFFDHYPGGMQEIFPNGGPSCVYEGAELGFHGEACKVPWSADPERAEDGGALLRCETRLARLPFALCKTFALAPGAAALRVEASIENLGRRDLRYMWGFHPAFGAPLLGGRTRLHCAARTLEVHPEAFGARQTLPPGEHRAWPGDPGEALDLLRGPESRSADLWYLNGYDDGWFVIENEDSGLAATMRWDARVFPYLWLWQECHDDAGYPWFGAEHVVGVEPWTSRPASGLSTAIENRTAPLLRAGETRTTALAIGVAERGERRGRPAGVSPDGDVIYEEERT